MNWRQRMGEVGMKEVLAQSIEAAKRATVIKPSTVQRVIEPSIGHMKNDGKLGRNWLKGTQGDAMHTVLCSAGRRIRRIINKLKSCRPITPAY
jgi:hypothetical protein